MKETYYLIYGRLVGKADEQGYFLFQNGQWVADKGYVILDHLHGYDPYEPEGSPYAMYNMSIMDEMDSAIVSERKAADPRIKKYTAKFGKKAG